MFSFSIIIIYKIILEFMSIYRVVNIQETLEYFIKKLKSFPIYMDKKSIYLQEIKKKTCNDSFSFHIQYDSAKFEPFLTGLI